MSDLRIRPGTRLAEVGLACTVLRGVRVLGGEPVDVLTVDGQVAAVARTLSVAAAEVDAAGLILLPGLVDLHTHLREPGGEAAETVATGTRAAAAGGFTDVFAMANTNPVTDTADRVTQLTTGAANRSARVHVVGAITQGLDGAKLSPLTELAESGVTVFSDDGRCVDDARLVRDALRFAASHDLVVAQHAQHGQLASTGQVNAGAAAECTGLAPWPGVAEEIVIARDAILAAETGGHLHVCHVSTRRSVEIVRWAKQQGWPVTAEVAPHHLILTDEVTRSADPRFKVNPPLRGSDDVRALRAALLDGTIDAIATDHAPHTAESKAAAWPDAPFGMTALETALPVLARVLAEESALDWALVARLMSANPAIIGRVAAYAGRPTAVGEPATFTLVDPESTWTVDETVAFTKSTNTPFVGTTFNHRIVATAVNGRLTHH